MEPEDAAEAIQESGEELKASDERFRRRAALLIGVMAMLLAIAGLGGDNATKEMVNSNILASDTWAFYQAKNVRQTSNQLAAEELELTLASLPSPSAELRSQFQQRIDRYKATVARYESEPDPSDPNNPLKGEGKQQLMARAMHFEERRDHAQQQDPNFDYSQALLQIAIVLSSVSIVAAARPLLWIGAGLGTIATLLMINGFTLLVDLPIG
jgi:hypothetical protein